MEKHSREFRSDLAAIETRALDEPEVALRYADIAGRLKALGLRAAATADTEARRAEALELALALATGRGGARALASALYETARWLAAAPDDGGDWQECITNLELAGDAARRVRDEVAS